MVIIVDYGLGNVGSIRNMLKRAGVKSEVSGDPKVIARAERLVLPGVGAFDHGMKRLAGSGLIEVLNEKVLGCCTPVLGICLGMQLLGKSSEEGVLPGLGWLDADTVRFRFHERVAHDLRIPHMGWNWAESPAKCGLFHNFSSPPRFYFVHAYHVVCHDPADVAATTRHGYDFPSAVQKGHIFGTQFHPEKSHKYGLVLLKNFLEMSQVC